MPRRLFSGKSHTDPTTDQISKPTLVHTDALPRSDLHSLGRVTPRSAGTGGAEAQTTVNEWDQPPSSFRDRGHGSNPPSSSGSMASHHDPQTIGVALGSPSVYTQPPRLGTPTARPGTSNSIVQPADSPPSPPKRKTSRWKKIGGLFRAKQALDRSSPAPFYQVRLNDQEIQQQQQQQPLRSSPETVSAPPVAQPPWANGYPKNHDYREIFPEVEDDDKRQDVKGDWKPNGYARGEAPWDFLKDDEENQRHAAGKEEPLLKVDIPDVHMERYSVMFGNLLGKGNRSTLLARRSKHLEKLKTQEEGRNEPGEHQALKPPRRATSPNPAKSPSFTLFPTAPKGSKGSAPQNAPSRPHHLHPLLRKSHTAPVSPGSRNHESQPSSSSSQFASTLQPPRTSSRNHESQASSSSSQFALAVQSPRPSTPSNLWAAERNAYLSPIVSEAPSTSSGGTIKAPTKPLQSPLPEEKEEEKLAQNPLHQKKEEKPINADEAMAQLEESTRQLKMLAKTKDKKESNVHRPATAEGRGPARPTIATAMSSQTIALRENPPSRAPPHPPPDMAVPSPPRGRPQTAPSGSARPKTPNSTQFPPRKSSATNAKPVTVTPPRTITSSPPPLSSSSAEDLVLSHPDHHHDEVQVHVARSISVTKTANAQRIRQQQQQQQQRQQKQKQQQQQKQKQKQQLQEQEQQQCQQQKQPRQMLVPVGARIEPFRPDERLVERYHSPRTPTLVENLSPEQSSGSGDSPFRRSQNVLIETA